MDWKIPVIWLVVMLVLAFMEAATTQLVTIWFALGALVALLASILHAPLWLQIVLFAAVSTLALIFTRPLAKKLMRTDKVPTNADRVLHQTGVVQDAIDNAQACGTVQVDGAVWSARAADDLPIASGTLVRIERIEGVKLIVTKAE